MNWHIVIVSLVHFFFTKMIAANNHYTEGSAEQDFITHMKLNNLNTMTIIISLKGYVDVFLKNAILIFD